MRIFTQSSIPLWDNSNLKVNRQPWVFRESAARHSLPYEIMGFPHDWTGRSHGPWMVRLLGECDPNEVILFTDSWDVMVCADAEEMEQKFLAMGRPIIHAAEANPFPSVVAKWQDYPPSQTSARYINGGGLVGYASFLLEMFSSLDFFPKWCQHNQHAYHYWMVHHQDTNGLDRNSEIFMCLQHWDGEGRLTPEIVDGRYVNTETKSQPCLIHGCGGGAIFVADLWKKLKEQL